MCFQEKMLAGRGKKETDSSVRSFRFTWTDWTWHWKVNCLKRRWQTFLCNRFSNLGRGFFEGKRGKNRHPSDKPAQRDVRVTVFADKFQGVLGLAQVRSFRIGVHDIGHIWLWNQAQKQIYVETYWRTSDGQIGEFIVDVSVKDNEVGIRAGTSGDGNAKTIGVEQV